MKPLVSILIPVYNRRGCIAETLDSALGQTYRNTEIIVVDNCSSDGTWEILNDYAARDGRIRIFRNSENIGPVRNWKKCIDQATGEYAKILWSDDLIEPTFIEKTLPFLTENADVGFVFTGTEAFFEGGERAPLYFIGATGIYPSIEYIEQILLGTGFPVSPGCALFRKNDLEKNLIVDVANRIGSDFSMHAIGNDALIFLITASTYPRFAFVNEVLSFFRAHNDSITLSTSRNKISLLYQLAKAFYAENYLGYVKVRRKFNALLFHTLLSERNRSPELALSKVADFYMDSRSAKLDYLYLFQLLCRQNIIPFLGKFLPGKLGRHKAD